MDQFTQVAVFIFLQDEDGWSSNINDRKFSGGT